MISTAPEKFDAQGNLTDERTRQRIKKLLEALVEWTNRLNAGKSAHQTA
jgi:chromate reductase